MAGLLDAQDAALMALGTGLLGGGTFAQALGRGGQGFLSTYAAMQQAAEEKALKERELAMRAQLQAAQIANYESEVAQRKAQADEIARKAQQAQALQQALPGLFGTQSAPTVQGDAYMPGAPPEQRMTFDAVRAAGLGLDPEKIKQYHALTQLDTPEVARVEETTLNGRPVKIMYDKAGRRIGAPLEVWKAPVMTDLGGRVAATDPVTLTQLAAYDKTQTPDSKASNAVQWANHRLAQQRLNLERENQTKPTFHNGQWVFAPTPQNPTGGAVPVPGFTTPPGEGQKKQLSGIESLNSAIGEYLTEMEEWSNKRMLNPDARARMGTKYNNMMLQAKEAYNLGVLNGPDLEILTSVIADPRKPFSAFLSNDTLTTQAKELRRMMNQTANATRSGGAGAGIQPGTVDGGYRFKGGDPANKNNWEKVQ